jgi:hypothetical protein
LFLEADSIGKDGKPTNDDISETAVDDGVQYELPTDHDGWKLFSTRYSDIPFAGYCNQEGGEGFGCGPKKYDPNRIDLIAMSFESDSPEQKAKAAVEYIIFTIDEPFDPTKF